MEGKWIAFAELVLSASKGQFDEQQSDGCPHDFAQSDEQCHKDSGTGGKSQSGCRHEKAPFPTPELQREEEEQVGKQGGESQNQHTVGKVGSGHQDQQHEIDFE